MAEFQVDGTRPRSSLRTALAIVAAMLIASPAVAGVSAPERCLAGVDFNGDGKADLLFEGTGGAAAGSTRTVMMDGVTLLSQGFFSTGGGAWPYGSAGDTNDDGRTDLLGVGEGVGAEGYFRIELLDIDGTGVDDTGYLASGGGAWENPELVGCTTIHKDPDASVQDLNGDGQADVVTIGATGSAGEGFWRLQVMNASGVGSENQGFVANGGGAWELRDSADFNGDGRGDLVSEGGVGTGAEGYLRIDIIDTDGTGVDSQGFLAMGGGAWEFLDTGDTNGDGRADTLQLGAEGSSADGFLRIQLTNEGGTTVGSSSYLPAGGGAWVLAAVEDMNDDGRDDLIWVGQVGTGAENLLRIQIIDNTGLAVESQGFESITGYTFLDVIDTDGNGRADLVLYTDDDVEIRMTESDGISFGDTGTVTRGAGGVWMPVSP